MNDSGLSVRWVDSADDIPPALWEQCFPPPLEGRWWYTTLERCGIEDQFSFAYALIQRDGHAVGIAPTFRMDVPLDIIAPDHLAGLVRFAGRYIRFLRYQRTCFVGSPCSDEGSVGLVPGVPLESIIPTLQTALMQRARETRAAMIVWKDFVAADATALAQCASELGLFRVTSYPGSCAELPAGDFDAYLKTLKSSHRNKLRKKLRRGQEACATSVTIIQRPDSATMDEIFGLFWQTFLKGKTKFERLNRRFFDLIAHEEVSHFVLLRSAETGRLVAFMLCFDLGQHVINKFIGLDYSIENAFLYFQLWQAAVSWAMGRGAKQLQSGQTGYSAKLEIGHTLVPLDNFCRHRNPLVHRLFAWQARGISWETIDADLKLHVNAHGDGKGQQGGN